MRRVAFLLLFVAFAGVASVENLKTQNNRIINDNEEKKLSEGFVQLIREKRSANPQGKNTTTVATRNINVEKKK